MWQLAHWRSITSSAVFVTTTESLDAASLDTALLDETSALEGVDSLETVCALEIIGSLDATCCSLDDCTAALLIGATDVTLELTTGTGAATLEELTGSLLAPIEIAELTTATGTDELTPAEEGDLLDVDKAADEDTVNCAPPLEGVSCSTSLPQPDSKTVADTAINRVRANDNLNILTPETWHRNQLQLRRAPSMVDKHCEKTAKVDKHRENQQRFNEITFQFE